MALQKALLLSLFSLLVLTTATHAIMEDLAEKVDQAKDLAGQAKDLIGKTKDLVDQAKSSLPPLANSPTASVPLTLDEVEVGIREICTSTDYPSECVEAVAPFLDGHSDPVAVAGFAIRGVMERTNEAIAEARRMSKEARSPAVATIVNEIRESYEDALENFQSAMDALQEHDIGTMNSMLSAAITDFSDNEDKLGGRANSLMKYDDKLSKMTSNCLAITSLVN